MALGRPHVAPAAGEVGGCNSKSAHIRTHPTRAREAQAICGSMLAVRTGHLTAGCRMAPGPPHVAPAAGGVGGFNSTSAHIRTPPTPARLNVRVRRAGAAAARFQAFRRAASRMMADRDSGPGRRSVWLMAGHIYSQGVGRSAGKGTVLTPSSECPSQEGAGIACGKRSGSSIVDCLRNRDKTQPIDAGREEWMTAAETCDLLPNASFHAVIHF